jgi:hypothetical protein
MTHGKPITSCGYLVDISNFGLKQAWSLKDYTQDISKLLADSYPEVIDYVLVSGPVLLCLLSWSPSPNWSSAPSTSFCLSVGASLASDFRSHHIDPVT